MAQGWVFSLRHTAGEKGVWRPPSDASLIRPKTYSTREVQALHPMIFPRGEPFMPCSSSHFSYFEGVVADWDMALQNLKSLSGCRAPRHAEISLNSLLLAQEASKPKTCNILSSKPRKPYPEVLKPQPTLNSKRP